jgi:hypothetical protein
MSIFIPGQGAVGTQPPNHLTITPDNLATEAPDWTWIGDTSTENNVSLSKEGGEVTRMHGWWKRNRHAEQSPTEWALSVNAIEIIKTSLDLAFNGRVDATDGAYVIPTKSQPVEKAVFLLILFGTERMGIYLGKTSISLGDAPEFDPEAFLELPLSAAILSDDVDLMRWYVPALTGAAAQARAAGVNVTVVTEQDGEPNPGDATTPPA